MTALRYHVVKASDVLEGDVFVDEDWKDSGLWGRRIGVIVITEDDRSERLGRLVHIPLLNLSGDQTGAILTREDQTVGILR